MSFALHTQTDLVDHALDPGDPQTALDLIQRAAPARFFAGAGDPAVARALLERCPDHCREIGESSHLVQLAQAYAITSDPGFVEACVSAIDADVAAEPADLPRAWNAADGPDAALRLIAWCWVLILLRGAPGVTGTWTGRVVSSIGRHAARLHHAISAYCPPPTHLTCEALALLYAGTVFRELASSAVWREAAVRVLVTESQVQIAADGVHVDQSSWFHRFTIDVYLHFLVLAARNGIPVPPSVSLVVERMVEFLLSIRQPDGSIPQIGDSDGNRLLPLATRGTADARDSFAIAAVLFGRRDFAWAAEGFAPELAWLLGSQGIHAFDGIRPAPPATARSRVFPSGGYAVMSSGWERDAHQMVIDVGPLGCATGGGHGHADLLAVQCAIFGEPTIVDPGTHGYPDDSKWRDYFRSTAAHSTVTIDGESQAEPSGAFGWRRRPRVRLREWHSTAEFDFLDAEHDGYTRLPDPVWHRRRAIFVKPAFWILVDDLIGAARHRVDLTFQFAPSPSTLLGANAVSWGPHPWARAHTSSGQVLWISPFPSAPAQPTLKCGVLSPILGWTAPDFGRLRPAPMLIYSFAVALPWRIVTLLLPDRQGLSSPPAVRPIYDDGGLPNGFVFDRPRRTVRFDDRAVLVERD
jgi:hypothetical protein